MENLVTARLRSLLEAEFAERLRRNPDYSLRAYARNLGIGAPALSEILQGKRTIGRSVQKRLATKLVAADRAIRGASYNPIEADAFALIADWYHYGILEAMKLKGFQPSFDWVAKRLGIKPATVKLAVRRLVRLGLVRIDSAGHWHDASDGSSTNILQSNRSSAGGKNLQKQILEQSLDALENVAIEARNHTSMTMAIDAKDLPKAKAMIAEFRRELCRFLTRNEERNEVYQLAISLFPISKNS